MYRSINYERLSNTSQVQVYAKDGDKSEYENK